MKVLIIGGTIFVGRRLVEAALARGHAVTTFNRGRYDPGPARGGRAWDQRPDLHRDVEKLRGDRNSDVSALQGRTWDAAIDTCGYVPSGVRRVIESVGGIGHYTFISSVSAYAELSAAGVDESAAVATITPERLREAEAMATGARKALCEQAAEQMMPGRVLNVRPGLIVGAHDYTDRFTYWVRRVARGGEVLAPGAPARRVRIIDACDLADWIIRMVELQQAGLYNATGAEDGLTMERMLQECRTVSDSDARFVWAGEKFLADQNVAPWSELPLWVPLEQNGIFEVRNDKAIAAGLTFRPLADTIHDTLEWDAQRTVETTLRAGMRHSRELALLARI